MMVSSRFQAQCDRFPVQHFLANVVFDQPVQFLLCRWSAPLPGPRVLQALHGARRDLDCPVVRAGCIRVYPAVRGEQQCANDQEMNQWFFQKLRHG